MNMNNLVAGLLTLVLGVMLLGASFYLILRLFQGYGIVRPHFRGLLGPKEAGLKNRFYLLMVIVGGLLVGLIFTMLGYSRL